MSWTILVVSTTAFVNVIPYSTPTSMAVISSSSTTAAFTTADRTEISSGQTSSVVEKTTTVTVDKSTTTVHKSITDNWTSQNFETNQIENFSTTTTEPVRATSSSARTATTMVVAKNKTRLVPAKCEPDYYQYYHYRNDPKYYERWLEQLANKCFEPVVFKDIRQYCTFDLVKCMVMKVKGMPTRPSEELCESYRNRFMGLMYRSDCDPQGEPLCFEEENKIFLVKNETELVATCRDRCYSEELPKNYAAIFKPCEEKDDAYHKYKYVMSGDDKNEVIPAVVPSISDEEFELYWSAMDDVIECLEKNISMVTARTTITKLYSPQRQKELYGISEYALSSIAVLWTMFCGVMICKLFHVICVVLLDMEVEDERD